MSICSLDRAIGRIGSIVRFALRLHIARLDEPDRRGLESPNAFTLLRDETEAERKLKIHCASVVVDGKNDPENLVIAARDGALRLEEVQLAGKRRMSAEEFLRGYNASVRLA